MISGQLKLKTLVSNIALQHIKAIETLNAKYQDIHCDLGMVKFIMILILIVVIILAFDKFRNSIIFRGWLFSNIFKTKLFIADAPSYVPIDLTGALLLENINLKKNWIWEVLEVDRSEYPCDIKWKRNKCTHIHCNTTCGYI